MPPSTRRWAANCSMLFTEVEPLRRPDAARAAGFTAVEFWWPFASTAPGDAEVDRFARAITDAGVSLVGLNLPGGDMAAGERGLVSVPGRGSELFDGLAVAVALAARLGIRGCNALYGNREPGADPRAQDELATRNLARISTELAAAGARTWLEPLSGVDAYPLRTAADALAVADRVAATGAPSPLLLADLYHLSANGDDVAGVLDRHPGRIGHVQLADHPGRGEPGTGTVPFAAHLAVLDRHGYDGWIAAEYTPSAETTATLGWRADLGCRPPGG